MRGAAGAYSSKLGVLARLRERLPAAGVALALALSASLVPLAPLLSASSAAAASLGQLRVTSAPALPTQILVDGLIADSWGLSWVQLPAGSHTVSFTDVAGYRAPDPQTVTVTAGNTTTVTGTFTPEGTLRLITSPPLAAEITIDNNPADDSGAWTYVPAGNHQVCFGAVAGYTPPPCQTVTVTAGNTTTLTGTYTASPAAKGQTGKGTLRVTTSPALASVISLTPQGGSPFTTDTWGLNWLELTPGTYTLAFSHIPGYSEPAPQTITVTAANTTTVTGTFTPRGTLKVTTSPALGATVSIDGNPADAWGVWTDVPTGAHQVCFGAVAGYAITPPCQTTTITAGAETDLTGTYSVGTAACGLAQAAFCDTFDAPAGTGTRSGDLNGTIWGVSRTSAVDGWPSPANGWVSPQLNDCGNTATVQPPHDIVICNGQLHESVNDGGGVTTLAMYPKQPFDFAGRTGTIVFDLSNDTQGAHMAWPELWMSDRPVPAPFAHEASWTALPRQGFGIRLAGCTDTSGGPASCPRGSPGTVGVDSAIVVRNYVADDTSNGGSLKVIGLDSVKVSGPGQMNHYQVQVSQNQLDIYGTDAYSGALNLLATPLRHIATIPNANLTLTRGLVWMEDGHYNADKFGTQRIHTFAWDNFGFDGPRLPRDLTFDVPDNTTPDTINGASGTDLGYNVAPNSARTLTIPGVTGIPNATAALLVFGFYDQLNGPVPLAYSINGHPHTQPWPFPWTNWGSPKTVDLPVNLSDLQAGDNTVTFTNGNYPMNVFNIDLILVGAGG